MMISPPPGSKCSQSAFTLIEVLIAMAIFAATSAILMSTFVNVLLAREYSVNKDLIHADLRAVRMQLLLEPEREAAENGGDYPTLNHGEARWQTQIEPTEVVDLFKVQLEIEFSEPKEEQAATYKETLYLLRPTWSEAGERSELLDEKRELLEESRDFSNF